MTVSTTVNKVSYTASAAQTTFAYTFKIFVDGDLKVYVNSTQKTLTTDYTVTGAGDVGGGNIIFGTGLAIDDIVIIERVLLATQGTDYVENDPFPADAHEDALDKLTMLIQQSGAFEDRSVRAPTVDLSPSMELPIADTRATKMLGFDADGDPVMSGSTVTDIDASVAAAFAGGVLASSYQFTGTGSQVAFTITGGVTAIPNAQALIITIDGVTQHTDTYTTAAAVVTFSTAPPLNADIQIRYNAYLGDANDASGITYNQGGTGASSRTVENKLQESVSVKDFGAVGDGVTDDTAAIQAALDSGENILIPKGTYLTGGLTLTGDNITILSRGTLVPSQNGVTTLSILGNHNKVSVNMRNTGDYTSSTLGDPMIGPDFRGINITGKGNHIVDCVIENFETCIRDYYSLNTLIENCELSVKYVNNLGWANDGILLYETTSSLVSNCLVVVFESYGTFNTQGTYANHPRGGVISDINGNNNAIYNCTIGEGFVASIHNEASQQTKIIGNRVYAASLCSIVGGSGIIENNIIDCPVYSTGGVYNNGVTTIAEANIYKNEFIGTDSSLTAIYLQVNGSNITVSDNIFNGSFDKIIAGNHAKNMQITNNQVAASCSTFCASSSVSGGSATISGNRITGTLSRGVSSYPLLNGVITNNDFSTATDHAIKLSGDTDHTVISGNLLYGPAGKYAVYLAYTGTGRYAVITGNDMSGRTSAVAAVWQNTSTQIVEANINNTFISL